MSFNGNLYETDEGLELTTKAQIHTHDSASNTALNVSGNNGYLLSENSATSTGLEWIASPSSSASSYIESVYDLSTTVPKKHFVEFFSSNGTIPDRWSSSIGVSGSITMPTGDNNGILLNTGTTANSYARLHFNNVNNFANDNASIIFIGSLTSLAANFEAYLGFNAGTTAGLGQGAGIYLTQSKANISSWSSGGAFTFTDSTVAADTSDHVYQVTLSGANVKTYIDGTLATTITTNLPSVDLQPFFAVNTSGTDRNFNLKYCEAWNI